jgi:hypothetical protein
MFFSYFPIFKYRKRERERRKNKEKTDFKFEFDTTSALLQKKKLHSLSFHPAKFRTYMMMMMMI